MNADAFNIKPSASQPFHPDTGFTPVIPEHQLIRCIGHGSYGEVWLARSIVGSYRAVKIVNRRTFDDDRPFEREFRGLLKFEPISRLHESQVDILQVGRNEASGYFYYVMELADDEGAARVKSESCNSQKIFNPEYYVPRTLQNELVRQDRLPFEECIRIGLALTSALAHLHDHGLTHRDIKPSNIIFIDGVPKLADIGLVSDVGSRQTCVGTMGFLPPEGSGTPQADIYSLGKVLYEIGFGRDRKDFPELPTDLREWPDREHLLEFNIVLLKACNLNPHERYSSAAAMHEDLSLLQRGESISRIRLQKRRQIFMLKATCASLFLTLIAALVWFPIHRTSYQSRQHLVEKYVADGMQLINEGDFSGALTWFAEALGLLDASSTEAYIHRIRCASVLQQCPKLQQIYSHEGPVNRVVLCPDQNHLATASDDGTARVWNIKTGLPTTPPLKHEREVRSVMFSPDGKKLLTASDDHTARVWDAATGMLLASSMVHSNVIHTAVFNSNGSRILTASSDGTARLWDANTCNLLLTFRHTNPVWQADFSTDGSRIITACGAESPLVKEGYACIWDAASGARIGPTFYHEGRVVRAWLNTNNKCLLSASLDGSARLWDIISGKAIFTFPLQGKPLTLAIYNPSESSILVADQTGSARIWNATNGEPITPILHHGGAINSAAFSPDGRSIATASGDQTVRCWDASTGRLLSSVIKTGSWSSDVQWLSDGKHLLTAHGDSFARLWQIFFSEPAITCITDGQPVHHAEFSPEGGRLITAGGGIGPGAKARLWNSATGLPTTPPLMHESAIVFATFSPDGQRVATASLDRTARVWDARSGMAITPPIQQDGPIWEVFFNHDGTQILTASGENAPGQARVWDSASGKPISPPLRHEADVMSASFSPDGSRVVTAGGARTGPGEARIWEIPSGRLISPIIRHAAPVWHVSFSPDGRTIATASFDQTARLWNADTGLPVSPPLLHGGGVRHARFSPDGRRIVTSSYDQTARIWDARNGAPVSQALKHAGIVTDAVFSPDGRWVITTSADETARVWNVLNGEAVTPPLPHKGRVSHAAFSSDNERFVTCCYDGQARIWRLVSNSNSPGVFLLMARALSSRQAHSSAGLVSLQSSSFHDAVAELKKRCPDFFLDH